MTDRAIAQLQSLFKTETALMQEFIAVLTREADALAAPTTNDVLHATTESKTVLAQKLSASATARHVIYETLGYPEKDASNSKLGHDYPVLLPDIDALAQAAQAAYQLNEANGIMIDTHLKYNQQALNELQLLSGMDFHLYDASGHTHFSNIAKTKIKAG